MDEATKKKLQKLLVVALREEYDIQEKEEKNQNEEKLQKNYKYAVNK